MKSLNMFFVSVSSLLLVLLFMVAYGCSWYSIIDAFSIMNRLDSVGDDSFASVLKLVCIFTVIPFVVSGYYSGVVLRLILLAFCMDFERYEREVSWHSTLPVEIRFRLLRFNKMLV